jgi:hypothetical protein
MHFACAAKLLAGSGNPALTVLTNFRDTTLRTGFMDNSPGKQPGPQGLKPALLSVLNGTAEAVPYPKPIMRPVLKPCPPENQL